MGAKKQYNESTAKEKLELVLLDLHIYKEENENFDILNDVNAYINENGMKINGNIVNVDGYKFRIDRNKLQIVSSLGNEETIEEIISIVDIGMTSFTIRVINLYDEENIDNITYIIDEKNEVSILEKEYIKENLEKDSVHTAKVIVTYKDGNSIESKTIKIELEPSKIYLFKEGRDCTEITGGWKGVKVSDDGNVNKVEPVITVNENGCMNISVTPISGKAGGGVLVNNKIDYKKYKELCIEADATLAEYGESSIVSFYINTSNPKEVQRICFYQPIKEKTVFRLDITKINEIQDIFIYIQARNGKASCNIYNVWLEK